MITFGSYDGVASELGLSWMMRALALKPLIQADRKGPGSFLATSAGILARTASCSSLSLRASGCSCSGLEGGGGLEDLATTCTLFLNADHSLVVGETGRSLMRSSTMSLKIGVIASGLSLHTGGLAGRLTLRPTLIREWSEIRESTVEIKCGAHWLCRGA